jgi:hypothetical protein
MLIFLFISKIEKLVARWRTILAVCILCFLLSAAVIIESAGIALVGAISVWLFLSPFLNPGTVRLRLKRFLPVDLFALLAEAAWLQEIALPSGGLMFWSCAFCSSFGNSLSGV